MQPHTCHARGCKAVVPPRFFMCRRHWYMLPRWRRDAIWEVYVPGQEVRKDPSLEYLEVAHDCIEWLAQKEAQLREDALAAAEEATWD